MRVLFMLAIAVSAGAAAPAATPKAVYDAATATLTLYYDEFDHANDGEVAVFSASAAWSLDSAKGSATRVVIDESMRDFSPSTCASWFYGYGKLAAIDGLENLDTSKVTSFRRFLRNAGTMTSLDLSTFDTSSATDMREMFYQLRSLATIYVSETFSTNKVSLSENMFFNCFALVGGAGTKAYRDNSDSSHHTYAIDASSAHVDGGEEDPGFFTLKVPAAAPAIKSVSVEEISDSEATVVVDVGNLQGAVIVVSILRDGETVARQILPTGVCSAAFADLEAETLYSVKVVAENEYGSSDDTSCVFKTFAVPEANWTFDADAMTIEWGGWKFKVAVGDEERTLSVGRLLAFPETVSPLDFSRPVLDGDDIVYQIVELDPAFGYANASDKSAPAGFEPQCSRVGRLALPGEGLLRIGEYAFAMCSNATGEVALPQTLTTLGKAAFVDCCRLTVCGQSIPHGLTYIGSYTFRNVGISDVLDMRAVVSVADAAFQGAGVGEVVFGENLRVISGNHRRGAFQDCLMLTNVVFNPKASVTMSDGFTFYGCTRLETVDLCGVTNLNLMVDKPDYAHFRGCTSLKRVVFDRELASVSANALACLSALQEVWFRGPPPAAMETPLYGACERASVIKTFVPRRFLAERNAEGRCWMHYAEGGEINRRSSVWAADCRDVDDSALRPLLEYGPQGLAVICR